MPEKRFLQTRFESVEGIVLALPAAALVSLSPFEETIPRLAASYSPAMPSITTRPFVVAIERRLRFRS